MVQKSYSLDLITDPYSDLSIQQKSVFTLKGEIYLKVSRFLLLQCRVRVNACTMIMDMSDGGSYLKCTLLSGDLIKVTHTSENPAGYRARNILHSSAIQENKLNSTLHYR